MFLLPSKDKLFINFSRCINWEEKYLYIIELGDNLIFIPKNLLRIEYFVTSCQSKVWIVMTVNINGIIKFYGYSDTAIIRGLITLIFIFYNGLAFFEIFNQDIYFFFKKLSLTRYLTPSRIKGIYTILHIIQIKVFSILSIFKKNKAGNEI